jgi:MSHA biogenesis protein MshP
MNHQRGFGAIAAIVVLVILAAMAAALVSIGTSQQITSAQDVMSARAWQVARSGNEWGLFQALKGTWISCNGASQTLDLSADTGFHVTVSCDSWLYNEGESVPGTAQTVRLFRITAVACTVAQCPGADASSPGYIERTRVVISTN